MRRTIEITRHNCPADGGSITAEVTLDVSEGVVSHVGTRILQIDLDGTKYTPAIGDMFEPLALLAEALLEYDCDPVALAIEKLTREQGSGGAE